MFGHYRWTMSGLAQLNFWLVQSEKIDKRNLIGYGCIFGLILCLSIHLIDFTEFGELNATRERLKYNIGVEFYNALEYPILEQQRRDKVLRWGRTLRTINDRLSEIDPVTFQQEDQIKLRRKIGDQLRNLLLGDGQNWSENQFSDRVKSTGFFPSLWKGIVTGNLMQTRFDIFGKWGRSKETVASIRDLSMGKYGRSIIRFDLGRHSAPHINIDPKGYSSYKNAHIYVPSMVITGANQLGNLFSYAGSFMYYTSVLMDTIQMGSAINDDFVTDLDNRIEQIENRIELLTLASEDEDNQDDQKLLVAEITRLIPEKNDARLAKQNIPAKTIRTGASIAGGWGGGIAGAWAGAGIGSQSGAIIGSVLGPAGAAVGGVLGAVGGSIGGAIGGGTVGRSFIGELANKWLPAATTIEKTKFQMICDFFS